jgi:uncharacterized protein YqhQ
MNKIAENIEVISVVFAIMVFVIILLLLGTLTVEQQNEFMDMFLYQQLVK